MNKVDFLILGAQKCATSTLYNWLKQHPFISGCENKEPNFWNDVGDDWMTEIEAYHRLFPQISEENVLSFEASTIYSFYPLNRRGLWTKVHRYNPEMKFIYVVRNPVDRITSSYQHTFESGWENRSLNEAVIRNPLYVNLSRYWMQLSPWIETFGREKFCVVDFDELSERPQNVVREIYKFLDVESEFINDFTVKTNVTADSRKVALRRHCMTDLERI